MLNVLVKEKGTCSPLEESYVQRQGPVPASQGPFETEQPTQPFCHEQAAQDSPSRFTALRVNGQSPPPSSRSGTRCRTIFQTAW
mmetsp:Transcript_46867/g.100932  ORF Transcript_46867/g.100932 Transcript_46867/m.100932 type:complete len:84 (+) Transcript_46867:2079-2330(+)